MINSDCGGIDMQICWQLCLCKIDKTMVIFSNENVEMWLLLSPPKWKKMLG